MRKAIYFLFFLISGCSSNEDSNTIIEDTVDFKLTIDGVEINYPNENPDTGFSDYSVTKKGDLITVFASYDNLGLADSAFYLYIVFATNGKFISGKMIFTSVSSGHPTYDNFINFPSNYFTATTFTLDEPNKKIKLKFAGKLYENDQEINSDSREILGELDMEYLDEGNVSDPIVINNIEQYCRANFNSTPWFARFEHIYSSFTNEDAYKIETHFANSPTPGSFNFDSSSTDNYVKLSKFNPLTLSYDYYNVTGQVGYTYREFHGFNKYSFIGTFSFTAVNPNNPSDIIQVTNGEFRSYQNL